MTRQPKHYAFRFADVQNDDLDKAEDKRDELENKLDEDTDGKTPVQAELETDEFVLTAESANALGTKFLDYVNHAFAEDADANPLEVLVYAMQHLPEMKSKAAMSGPSHMSDQKISEAALAGLGRQFLDTLQVMLRLNGGDAKKAIGNSEKLLELLPKKQNFNRGGRVIGADPPLP